MALSEQSYPLLSQVSDRATRELFRLVLDRVHSLEGRAKDPAPLRKDLDLGDHRVTNIAEPEDDTDAVTKVYAEENFGPEAIRADLQVGGEFPLDVTNLTGTLAYPQKSKITVIADTEALPDAGLAQPYELLTYKGVVYYFNPDTNPGVWTPLTTAASLLSDTHANRLANYPAASQSLNTLFYETDRTVIYKIGLVAGVKTWQFLLGQMRGTLLTDQRPIDLGVQDANFRFEGTDIEEHYRWDGSTWALLPNEAPKWNLVKNGGMEWYETWDPAATPAVANPSHWTASVAGGGSAGRSTTQVKQGTYAVALINGAANSASLQQDVIPTISASVEPTWRSRTVILTAWVHCGSATRARIRINDGISTGSSSYHTGGGTWEQLILTHTLAATATRLRVELLVDTGASITTYFDDVKLTDSKIPPRAPFPHGNDLHMYPFRVEVFNNTNQTLATATETTLTWNAENTDKGELHSITANTSRLTIPTGGGGTGTIWVVYGQVQWAANATGDRYIVIWRNGAMTKAWTTAKSTTLDMRQQIFGVFFDMADGDYFELRAYQDSGGNLGVVGGAGGVDVSHFGAFRVL